MELTANHIHVDTSDDILSPLRIALIRAKNHNGLRKLKGRYQDDQGYEMQPGWGTYAATQWIHQLIHDIETTVWAAQEAHETATWEVPDESTMLFLSAMLAEAVRTAHDDGMPNCADRMLRVHTELTSGRAKLILVLGRCYACWPNR